MGSNHKLVFKTFGATENILNQFLFYLPIEGLDCGGVGGGPQSQLSVKI